MLFKHKIILITGLLIAYLGVLGILTYQNHQSIQEQSFGSGYRPVTNYDARTTAYITDSATSISVNSTKDKAGNEISLSNISPSSTVYVYFTLEPGTAREELIACNGKSVNTWGPTCLRGLSYQGGSLTPSSTLASAHNAGSRIIMSDIGQFFGEYVSITGTETLYGVKTFDSFPKVTSTTAVPSTAGELATKYYVDNIGSGGFTASNVSSTLGLQVITSGIPNCPSAAACVGINASSTASDNGGFLNFTPITGTIYWDIVSFLTGASRRFTTLIADTFTGTSTNDNLQITGTPNSANDAVNKNYVDAASQQYFATGTAGVAITAGQALYMSTTGTLFLADADSISTSYQFAGFALTSVSGGAEVSYAKPGGIITNQSGLTQGNYYYISGTAGGISATPGGVAGRVAFALSTTSILILHPSFYQANSGTQSLAFDGTADTITTTFIPTKVTLLCDGGTQANSTGFWSRLTGGSVVQRSRGTDDDAIPYEMLSNSFACSWEESANVFTVSIATTTGGFTLTPANIGGTPSRNIYWFAEYTNE